MLALCPNFSHLITRTKMRFASSLSAESLQQHYGRGWAASQIFTSVRTMCHITHILAGLFAPFLAVTPQYALAVERWQLLGCAPLAPVLLS